MKSVLKTFSQNTKTLLGKACLAVLCVFVFSSMGNAQSFMNVDNAQVELKAVVSVLKSAELNSVQTTKVKRTDENGNVAVQAIEPADLGQEVVRHAYYSNLMSYIGHREYPNAVAIAIDESHQRMIAKYSDSAAYLEALKLEVIDLLTN